ncbi:YbaB/EbfC DNA-binding family protein [Saccharopolyspora antimicrobica]|uniref:YbaB/EbfC DNA-binding family protein n=1 Tax=Saccharopolyspora antimicrobica TaxID=455193 RepID=A0A1I5J817_9PSEU|nr:YbaB/EbfC family nucleoid-associated protein [Saccharopolyspora antimicrobica]RKT82062.1 YbaB/EbfC DNA-binding family protein [Saccharopolyspora antimicrobica]SFO68536.1 YbaB/EbfC DNA-binding family protein [Saccharopolyspora antimicrobica]
MDGNILDPDGARERLAAWKDRIEKLAADTKTMSDRLQEVRVTTTDPKGLVELTIDSTGALVDIKLTSKMERTAPDVVSRTIMETLAQAKNQLADRSQEIIADTVGTESAAARAISESVGNHLRTDEPADPAPEPDVDDGTEPQSFMEKW